VGRGSSYGFDSLNTFLWRDDQKVGCDAVALHAVLGILDRLVEAALVLLASSVGSHLALHRHADVALGADLRGRQETRCSEGDRSGIGVAEWRGQTSNGV